MREVVARYRGRWLLGIASLLHIPFSDELQHGGARVGAGPVVLLVVRPPQHLPTHRLHRTRGSPHVRHGHRQVGVT